MKTVDLETSETLKNGVTVHIRSVRPGDKAGIVEVFGELRPESVYTRFFQHKASLSPQELETATEVDPDHGVALVATVESGGRQRIVAGGRYVTIDPSSPQPRAEIAFLVAEDFHGLGLAGRILQHLARIARQRSVHQFEAAVLPQNKAMLAVFSRSGLPMKQLAADGMVYVTLSLLEPSGTALT